MTTSFHEEGRFGPIQLAFPPLFIEVTVASLESERSCIYVGGDFPSCYDFFIRFLRLLVGNRTYTPTTLAKEEILDNHRSVLYSFGISTKDEELDLPSLY